MDLWPQIITNFHPSFSYHVKPYLILQSILSIQLAREEENSKGKFTNNQISICKIFSNQPQNKFRIDAYVIDLIWIPIKGLNIQPKGEQQSNVIQPKFP